MKPTQILFPVLLGLPHLSQAADITWQAPQTVSSYLDVNTQGTLVFAKDQGFTDTTVNGVPFNSTGDLSAFYNADFSAGAVGFANGLAFIGANDTEGQNYAKLLNSSHFSGGTTATITLSSLTIGQQYLIQYFVADYRGYANDRSLTLTGGANVSTELKYLDSDNSNGGIHASHVIGTFTADATTQVITVNANESAQLNGLQLRTDIAFTDANGIWTGADGNWNTAGNWQSAAIAQGVDKSATFNGLNPVTATVDVGRPIGALLFSGANHTIAAGAGSLALDTDTVFTSPTITVADGFTATIGALLTGSEGMTKTGLGTLLLNGSRTYTGSTEVAQGTLQYQGGAYASTLHSIATGAVLDLSVPAGSYDGATTTFGGAGTLRKTGAGTVKWGVTVGSFALDPGALIDVQEGTFTAGSDANESWAGNLSDLNVASGATFDTVEANVRVNKITGSGTIATGYSNVVGYQNLTIGVDNGSSSFDGVIADSVAPGNLVKAGTGTITLAGLNTYTGNTTIGDGTLVLADNAQLKFVVTNAPASNRITGSGAATFNGDFVIDTTAVTGTTGFIWTLVDRASLTGESFDPLTFSVVGFTDANDDGIWVMTDAKGDWSFNEASGELTLDVGNDYDDWGSAYGLAQGSETGDLDNDGLTNEAEYAFGLIPNSGSSVNPISVPLDKATGKFRYTRRATPLESGLTYTVWTSENLSGWAQDSGATASQNVISTAGGVETVEVTLTGILPLAQPKLFIQVRAN